MTVQNLETICALTILRGKPTLHYSATSLAAEQLTDVKNSVIKHTKAEVTSPTADEWANDHYASASPL